VQNIIYMTNLSPSCFLPKEISLKWIQLVKETENQWIKICFIKSCWVMAFHDDVDEVEHYDDPDNGEESSQVRLRS
jgi:hypothetical protein